MNSTHKPIGNPVAVLREEFDDWAVLFNPDTAQAFGTNPVGVFIWKMMDGKKSVEEIAAAVKEHFGEVPESAASEVGTFVDQLEERGFIGREI
jgi:SynChlorMet cassette protein ScmD